VQPERGVPDGRDGNEMINLGGDKRGGEITSSPMKGKRDGCCGVKENPNLKLRKNPLTLGGEQKKVKDTYSPYNKHAGYQRQRNHKWRGQRIEVKA